MAFDWFIFLRILKAILDIIGQLPADTDVRPITSSLSEATDVALNGGKQT